MLKPCPECSLQVSDKAIVCPHCGYPLEKSVYTKYKKGSAKRKRLPNGFGQISEIKGSNLRKPFRAMVSTGIKPNGRPICKLLKPDAYFETYNEAYAALVEYNKNPYSLEPSITVEELYKKWTESYFKELTSDTSIRTIENAWHYCSSLYKMRASDIRAYHIKNCMEDGVYVYKGKDHHTTANIKGRIKSMFNLMLDYALEYEIVDKNYARTFDLSENIINERESTKRSHMSFTDDEIEKLWANINVVPYIDLLLIQCYSGWRPQEIGRIEISDVHLDEWYYIGGMKTQAGIRRIVPIHEKIRELVKVRYDEAVRLGSKYLFNCTDGKTHTGSSFMTYDKYNYRFEKIRDFLKLNPEHRAHDGRKWFITNAKKYNMDEYAIKYIVGHSIQDVTEKVYTERDVSWLASEIAKIK